MKEQPKSRENGFYPVKWANRWVVAEWDDGQDWYLPGFENCFEDKDFEEIDERKISRVSGEPPKPEHTPISENEGNKDKAVKEFTEMTAKHIMTFFYLMGLKSHIESMVVNQVNGEEFIFSFQTVEYFKQRNKTEVSGEAKTPDQQKIPLESELMEALAWKDDEIRTLKLKIQDLTGGSVPTPSDVDIEYKAMEKAKSPEIGWNDSRGYRAGFAEGAKWMKEWLRSSTNQRVGNPGNKG